MALNQVIYLPNPAGAYNKMVGATVAVAGTSTLQTAIPASTYVRVRNFSITLLGTAGAAGDFLHGTLKIGAAQFTCSAVIASGGATLATAELSSDDVGFDGGWLQPTDTITFIVATSGLTVTKASVSVSLEDFTV